MSAWLAPQWVIWWAIAAPCPCTANHRGKADIVAYAPAPPTFMSLERSIMTSYLELQGLPTSRRTDDPALPIGKSSQVTAQFESIAAPGVIPPVEGAASGNTATNGLLIVSTV